MALVFGSETLEEARARAAERFRMIALAVEESRREENIAAARKRFRDIERKPPKPRIPEEARPTPEQRRDRQGRTFPDPALRGTDVGDRQQRLVNRYTELLEEIRQSFPTRTPPGTTIESLALERLEEEFGDELRQPERDRGPVEKLLRETIAGTVTGTALKGLAAGVGFLEETPGVGGPLFRQPRTGKTAFEEGAEISRPVVRTAQPIVAEPFEQVEAAGIPVVSPAAGGVATAIESKIVEDIATELINPAALVLAAPLVMQATQGLRGAALAAQMSSNLLGTGMEPALVRGTLRGLTAIGTRGAAAARTLPRAIQETPIIRQALKGAREFPEAGARPLRGGEEAVQGRLFADDPYIARGDPGPPPPRKPVAGGATPDDPEFDDILNVRLKGEKPEETLIRRHQGAISTATRIAANEVRDNNKILVAIGLGRKFRGSVVAKVEGAFNELNSLLHNPSKVASGDRIVPDELRPVYDKLRAQTDFEQAARIDFDPDMALAEDYFFRGWQPPEGMFTGEARGALGRNPVFKLPRVDATYDEMIEAGFRPLFDNPAEQALHSQLMGVKYREQMKLIDKIKSSELALPVVGGPVPKGWRVPKVGPAFEGKPYADGTRVAFTRRWAVLDSLANRLENAYGKTPELKKGTIFGKTIDSQKAVDAAVFLPKRAKLIGSVFQHVDFLGRSHVGAWTGFLDALRRGEPVTAAGHLLIWPQSAADIVRATFSPGFRNKLARLSVDDTPLFEGRKLSNKMISEAGLSLRDETLLPELDAVIREVAAEGRAQRWGKAPFRLLGDLERAWRKGLFEGVYPAAILTDVKNNIAPMIVRQHPDATDAQLAGMIAKQANISYSTVPASMSVVQNQQARWFLTRFLFSLGENEGLLRAFAGAIRGENAAFFRTRLLGTYLGMMVLANTIHVISTGKPLPFDRFSPISKDAWGPLPVGYNTNFAAPNIPLTGRSSTEITLDLMGQMDTAFRILDPKSFLSARMSVPARAFENQRTGKDFFGAPIDTVGPGGIFSRTAQLAQDLFAPIGPGQAGLEILRSNIEETEGLIQEGEARLGTAGIGVQATGVNLRAEQTPQLLDRIRNDVMQEAQIEASYDELNQLQKSKVDDEVEKRIGQELELRRETSALRGQTTLQGEGFEAIETSREAQQTEQLTDDAKVRSGQWTKDVWVEGFRDRQKTGFDQREQIKIDFKIEFADKEPSNRVDVAIDSYWNINIDDYVLPGGATDWTAFFDAQDATLKPLTASEKKEFDAIRRKFDTPMVKEFRKVSETVDQWFDIPKYTGLKGSRKEQVRKSDEIDEVKDNIQEEARRIAAQTGNPEVDTQKLWRRRLLSLPLWMRQWVQKFILRPTGGSSRSRLTRVSAFRARGGTGTFATFATLPGADNPERFEFRLQHPELTEWFPGLFGESRELAAALGEASPALAGVR